MPRSNTIFVTIPSYADSEIVPTIKSLLDNADNPQLLDIYTFCQTPPSHNLSQIEILENVNVIRTRNSNSKGVCWALGVLHQNLQPNHGYFLQIDSHMEFDKGWDTVFKKELDKLPDKSVISVYPPQYYLNPLRKTKGRQVNYVDHLRKNGSLQFGAKNVGSLGTESDEPIPNSTIACGFIFGPVEFLTEVPQDPYMDFTFQEMDITLRAFTHGWNIYAPGFEGYYYHLYERPNKLADSIKDDKRGINTRRRMYAKLGVYPISAPGDLDFFRISEYKMGNKRSIQEFENIYNVKLLPDDKKQKVVSIPVAVHNDHFKWQLDLFWYNHKRLYKSAAYEMAHAIIMKRNHPSEKVHETLEWDFDIPHSMCDPFFDYNPEWEGKHLIQTNIQIGLLQILEKFTDDQVIEILDCDQFHISHRPVLNVNDDEVYVATDYEDWHLKSKTDNKKVIDRYLHKVGGDYNGGFVPIICNIRTLKKILPEWVAVNVDIVEQDWEKTIFWWSSMFALSASCEKNNVRMYDYNRCYIHRVNKLTDDKYICHYSVDGDYIHKNNREYLFSKKNYDKCVDSDNRYANLFAEWLKQSEYYGQLR